MVLRAGDLNPQVLRFDRADPVIAHAANELRLHLGGIVQTGNAGAEITLESRGGNGDGFTVTVATTGVSIVGEGSRGALNGAYWLLEAVGFLWVRPGETGAVFAPGKVLGEGSYSDSPSFPTRTLILGNDALHDEWPDWLEFASRNRLNSVFFHDTPPSVLDRGGASRPATAEGIAEDGKGWMFERWDRDGTAILKAAADRGMMVQFGGHHLPALVLRAHFEQHPDWFPERDGRRDGRYNLCTSSSGAMTELRARARDFFRRFRGASTYHLWADDILGGGWCSCRDCAELSPSDQALQATNVLAEELATIQPGSKVAHLAYHDTITAPAVFSPGTNVSALYAPRNRNYAYPINDPRCPRNREDHFGDLLQLAETFRGRDLAAFEYYSDAILFKWMAPPNLGILPFDASAYRQAGVTDFGNLAVTPRPWIGPTWHAWWFARCAWSTDADGQTSLRQFCEAAFGEDSGNALQAFRSLEEAYLKLLDLGELQRIPRHDVLDFSDSPRDGLARKAHELGEARDIFRGAIEAFGTGKDALGRAFASELSVQSAAVEHLSARIRAWDAGLDGRAREAGSEIVEARNQLDVIGRWAAEHSPAAYANLSRGMLRAARWHTEQIARTAGLADA
jgi:hypothetical protein